MTLTFNFSCKGMHLQITVKVEKQQNSFTVYANEFRPNLCLAFPDDTDFRKDTDYMVKAFETTLMNKNDDYVYPLIAMCQKHIREYGRIVDNDLFIYIDQMTLILKEVFKHQRKTLTIMEGQKLWKLSKDVLFGVFEDNIWVDKKHYLGYGNNELVKYTSIVGSL